MKMTNKKKKEKKKPVSYVVIFFLGPYRERSKTLGYLTKH